MAEFNYIARNNEGLKQSGVIEAATQAEAVAVLSGRALFPLSVDAVLAPSTTRIGRISAELVAATLSQLADLLAGGVPLLRALNVLRSQTSHTALKFVLGEVARHVEDGETLSEAMNRYPGVFGEMTVSMVRAGAEGGFLEQSLEQVAAFTEAQDDLKKRVIGALVYPCILLTVMAAVVTGLLLFIVPMIEPVFKTLQEKGELPILTRWLLALSDSLLVWTPILIVAMIVGVILFRRWSRSDRGRRWTDRAKLKMPGAGPLYEAFAVARFCRVLGTLLMNGVPIVRSLTISADATGNRILSDAIERATENITAGARLAEPLAASGSFPKTVVEMISVAEESNTLETVLTGIADRLEKRAWRKLDVVVRIIEPVMLVLLAGAVLVIVLALMLPMFKLSQAI